jgi:hypothetical protein
MAFRSEYPSPVANGERDLASLASNAVESAVRAGAALLLAEPWRVSRIIRGAEALTLEDLLAEVARRRRLPPAADFNRALALKQLARALDEPGFAAAWSRRRAEAESFRA